MEKISAPQPQLSPVTFLRKGILQRRTRRTAAKRLGNEGLRAAWSTWRLVDVTKLKRGCIQTAARITSAPSTPSLFFHMHIKVEFGVMLRIVGSAPELGGWDPKKGLDFEWTEGNIWKLEIDSPDCSFFEYKIVAHDTRNGSVWWEPCENRTLETLDSNQGVCLEWGKQETYVFPLPEATFANNIAETRRNLLLSQAYDGTSETDTDDDPQSLTVDIGQSSIAPGRDLLKITKQVVPETENNLEDGTADTESESEDTNPNTLAASDDQDILVSDGTDNRIQLTEDDLLTDEEIRLCEDENTEKESVPEGTDPNAMNESDAQDILVSDSTEEDVQLTEEDCLSDDQTHKYEEENPEIECGSEDADPSTVHESDDKAMFMSNSGMLLIQEDHFSDEQAYMHVEEVAEKETGLEETKLNTLNVSDALNTLISDSTEEGVELTEEDCRSDEQTHICEEENPEIGCRSEDEDPSTVHESDDKAMFMSNSGIQLIQEDHFSDEQTYTHVKEIAENEIGLEESDLNTLNESGDEETLVLDSSPQLNDEGYLYEEQANTYQDEIMEKNNEFENTDLNTLTESDDQETLVSDTNAELSERQLVSDGQDNIYEDEIVEKNTEFESTNLNTLNESDDQETFVSDTNAELREKQLVSDDQIMSNSVTNENFSMDPDIFSNLNYSNSKKSSFGDTLAPGDIQDNTTWALNAPIDSNPYAKEIATGDMYLEMSQESTEIQNLDLDIELSQGPETLDGENGQGFVEGFQPTPEGIPNVLTDQQDSNMAENEGPDPLIEQADHLDKKVEDVQPLHGSVGDRSLDDPLLALESTSADNSVISASEFAQMQEGGNKENIQESVVEDPLGMNGTPAADNGRIDSELLLRENEIEKDSRTDNMTTISLHPTGANAAGTSIEILPSKAGNGVGANQNEATEVLLYDEMALSGSQMKPTESEPCGVDISNTQGDRTPSISPVTATAALVFGWAGLAASGLEIYDAFVGGFSMIGIGFLLTLAAPFLESTSKESATGDVNNTTNSAKDMASKSTMRRPEAPGLFVSTLFLLAAKEGAKIFNRREESK